MALKKRDKIMIGLLTFAGAAFIILIGTLPAWDAFDANQKQLATLRPEVQTLETTVANLKAEIVSIQDNVPLPPGVELRKFKQENKEEMIKDVVDNVVKKAIEPGNKLIYLLPFAADPIQQSLTADEQKLVEEGKMQAPISPYETVGYEIGVRGTYGSLQDFLKALDDQKELVEIISISLVNESGIDRAGTKAPSFSHQVEDESFSDVILDPSKPIRLTAKLRLILERQ